MKKFLNYVSKSIEKTSEVSKTDKPKSNNQNTSELTKFNRTLNVLNSDLRSHHPNQCLEICYQILYRVLKVNVHDDHKSLNKRRNSMEASIDSQKIETKDIEFSYNKAINTPHMAKIRGGSPGKVFSYTEFYNNQYSNIKSPKRKNTKADSRNKEVLGEILGKIFLALVDIKGILSRQDDQKFSPNKTFEINVYDILTMLKSWLKDDF